MLVLGGMTMKMIHVTIQTKSFDKELEFYQDVVGLQIMTDLRPMGRNMIFLADRQGDTEIEIIENPNADNSGNEHFSIGFKTDDVNAKHSELEEKGFDVSPMINPMPQVQFFFVKDPAGVSVQFM